MDIQQILNTPIRVENLNRLISKHTVFESIDDMTDQKHNYRPTLYFDDSMNNIQRLELKEIAEFYDLWMIANDDPRRMYVMGG